MNEFEIFKTTPAKTTVPSRKKKKKCLYYKTKHESSIVSLKM